ncbi:hypothetical protein, conserved [Leishmania tarentolae]|uniref:C2H2-type domain-containing protein n=1 Tax=Leishmania tarentolae TaxID=5689 RepID=A0A640KDE1_LEITA|nr:hypothetical protein, conserved [Leishmania tarentolae]
MTNPAFEFVQGNERLDWGVLVSIDVERLMKSTNVDTLQRIIENIAFSRISRDEAALFTPDHILHLFQLSQVIIQYLVYSQEILAEINVKLNNRMEGQQATAQEQEALLQRLSDETNLLKKQVKTQRRTLLAYEYNTQAALTRGVAGNGAAGAAGRSATLYICPYCGDEYHKAESMQSHLRKRHNTTAASSKSPVTDTSLSPPPPAAGVPEAVPAAAPGPIATAEASDSLQQLRNRVEHLERDREVMERQQRENLILMMLGATRSQTTSPPLQQTQQQQQQPASIPTSAGGQSPVSPPPPTSPSPSPASPLPGMPASPSAAKTDTAVNVVPEHLQGIPVVPDISAMMNYNLSCQREASENALRRQLVDLEAEIRALRAKTLAEAPPVVRETPPSASSLGATASRDASVVARPAWVAELESAQKRQHLLQKQASSGSAAPPSLAPPLTPPPELPPPPPQQPQHDYTTGAAVLSPVSQPSHSQLSSAPLQSTSTLSVPPPLQLSSPAPQPNYDVQQQQQQQQPPPAALSPLPLVPDRSTPAIPTPSPTTAPRTEGSASPAATPTLSVSLPQSTQAHLKPYQCVDSSTNSSLTSTSTMPPHRSVSKGHPGVSPSLPSHVTPAMATAVATSSTTIPLPSTISASVPIPSVSPPGPGVGTYFSSRTSVPAAAAPAPAPLSVIPPPATHHRPPPTVTAPELSVPHPTPTPALPVTSAPLSHAPSLPTPVLSGGTGSGSAGVSSWSPPAPVTSTVSVPVPTPSAVPGAVKTFRALSSSSSSSSITTDSRFRINRRYEY